MRFLLLVLNQESGQWFVAGQFEDPNDLLQKGKAMIDDDPTLIYRLFDVDGTVD